ncbi:MAG: Ig-like domain repeat protein [Bifidobacteriaceae bacterium]|nr:Ig-like domain repeat protein [Bifidobacteriaceae bacterium]
MYLTADRSFGRQAAPNETKSLTHGKAMAAAIAALTAGLLVVTTAIAALPASAAPTPLAETASFVYADGAETGYLADLDGDYAVFTRTRNSSVIVAHFKGPNPADWEQTLINAPAGVSNFGIGGAISGQRLVVTGTAGTDSNIYVYTLSGANNWTLSKTLTLPTPPTGQTIGGFGRIVDMDGSLVAVGAPNSTVNGLSNAGAVYLADLDSGGIGRVTTGQPVQETIFGETLALRDGYLAVGSPQVNGTYQGFGTTVFRLGRVHAFKLSGTSATAEQVIDFPKNAKTYPVGVNSTWPFGITLTISGGLLYVASPGEVNYTSDDISDPLSGINQSSVVYGTSTQGAIYAFDPASGKQVGNKILPPPHSFAFGLSMDVSGDVLAGSSYNREAAAPGLGEIYVYDAKGLFAGQPEPSVGARSQPAAAQMLRPAGLTTNAYFATHWSSFGGEVAVSGQRLLAGSSELGKTGAAYIFEPLQPNGPRRGLTVKSPAVTYGQTATISFTSDLTGAEGGTVELTVGNLKSGPIKLNGRQGEWQIPAAALEVADHEVTAVFTPPETNALPVTVKSLHQVSKATTAVSLAARPTVPAPGDEVFLRGQIAGQYGTMPSGQVELVRGTTVLGRTTTDSAGNYSFSLGAGPVGIDQLIVRYLGDTNHLVSSADLALEIKLAPSPTPCPSSSPCPSLSSVPGPPPVDRSAVKPGPSRLGLTGGSSIALAGLAAGLVGAGLAGRAARRRFVS